MKLRLAIAVVMLFLLILILPFFVSQVESGTSTNTLYAHAETTTIGGVNYYLHKLSSADEPATTSSQSAVSVGRKLMGRWVYSLSGIVSIPSSTWTVTYRAMKSSSASSVVAHGDIDILIRKSDNVIRTTIATNVANSPSLTLTNTWQTLKGTCGWTTYTVVDQTDYLEVAYYIEVTTAQTSKSVSLRVDDSTLALADQTKIANVMFTYPNQAPVASFTFSPSNPLIYDTVTFDASASYDLDGSIVSYKWDFGDGNITTVTNPIITHVYTTAASTVNYTVTLTVTDNEGSTGFTTQIVSVTNPSILYVSLPAGTYIGPDPDNWLSQCWLLNITGLSGTFTVRVNNTHASYVSYNTHLIIALNNASHNYLSSLTVDSTTIPKTSFTYGKPQPYGFTLTWENDVYPTWFSDTYVVGDINPKSHKDVTVSVTLSNTTGVRMHFDAYGSADPVPPPPTSKGHVTDNPHEKDSTVLFWPPLNTPPIAYDQSVTTAEDTSKGITLTASDPDSDSLTYLIVTGPSHGNLSGSPPSVTYTPDPNYNGADSFTFKAYDGKAYSNVATVSITVTPVNDPPTAPVVDVTPNLPLTTDNLVCTVTTPSTDPDGDPITYTYEWYKNGVLQSDETTVTTALTDTVSSTKTAKAEVWKCIVTPHDGIVNGTSAQDQVTIVNSLPSIEGVNITPDPAYKTSTLTTTPYGWSDADGDAAQYLYQWQKWNGASWQDILGETSSTLSPDNFVKGDQIKVICTPFDGEDYGASKEDTITISNSPPSAPVIDVTPDFPVTTDDLVCIIITPSIDPDGDPVTYTYEWYKNDILQPAYTTNTLPASATTVGDVWKCVVTPHGSDGPPDEDQVTIQNSPPVLAYIGLKSVNELATLSFTATATDPDVPPQTLTFSLGAGAPPGASITSGGTFSWTPTEAQGPSSYVIRIIVSDGSLQDYEDITVTVNEVNVAPILDPIGNKAVNELTLLTFTATASDADLPAQTLTFSLGAGAPAGASITSAGVFTWTPTEAQGPGSYVIRIIVSDGIAQDYEDITVTVNEVNQPPVLNPIGSKTVSVGNLLQFTVTASDPDLPAQTLIFSASNLPPGATFNPSTRIFSWTPTSGQAGVYSGVHFAVTDGVLTDSEDITITVSRPPAPVGGYSISLTKQTPMSYIAAYTLLVALFGVALSLKKRKRK